MGANRLLLWRRRIEEVTGYRPIGFARAGNFYYVAFAPRDVVEMGRVLLEESDMAGRGMLESLVFLIVPPSVCGPYSSLIIEAPFAYPGAVIRKWVVIVHIPLCDDAVLLVKAEIIESVDPSGAGSEEKGGEDMDDYAGAEPYEFV